MRTINRRAALSACSLLLAACGAASNTADPASDVKAPVERFLAFYFEQYHRGLPGESQLPDLASFVTPEMLGLFEAALRGEDCYMEKRNYEGPPPVEGDLFSSLFEGGTSATYQLISRESDKATFEIEWTHDSPVSDGPFSWKDRVFLVKTVDGWRIADFAHDGDWEFMQDASVAGILGAVAEECSARGRADSIVRPNADAIRR
jgi:hypothetical protein